MADVVVVVACLPFETAPEEAENLLAGVRALHDMCTALQGTRMQTPEYVRRWLKRRHLSTEADSDSSSSEDEDLTTKCCKDKNKYSEKENGADKKKSRPDVFRIKAKSVEEYLEKVSKRSKDEHFKLALEQRTCNRCRCFSDWFLRTAPPCVTRPCVRLCKVFCCISAVGLHCYEVICKWPCIELLYTEKPADAASPVRVADASSGPTPPATVHGPTAQPARETQPVSISVSATVTAASAGLPRSPFASDHSVAINTASGAVVSPDGVYPSSFVYANPLLRQRGGHGDDAFVSANAGADHLPEAPPVSTPRRRSSSASKQKRAGSAGISPGQASILAFFPSSTSPGSRPTPPRTVQSRLPDQPSAESPDRPSQVSNSASMEDTMTINSTGAGLHAPVDSSQTAPIIAAGGNPQDSQQMPSYPLSEKLQQLCRDFLATHDDCWQLWFIGCGRSCTVYDRLATVVDAIVDPHPHDPEKREGQGPGFPTGKGWYAKRIYVAALRLQPSLRAATNRNSCRRRICLLLGFVVTFGATMAALYFTVREADKPTVIKLQVSSTNSTTAVGLLDE